MIQEWFFDNQVIYQASYATSVAAIMGVDFGIEFSLAPTMKMSLGIKSSSSTGVRSGAVIGAVLGLFLLVGPVGLLILRRSRKARYLGGSERIAEMSGHSTGSKKFYHPKQRIEMDGSSKPAEIDSKNFYVVSGSPAKLEAPHHERNDDHSKLAGTSSCTVADNNS
jgi:hypothetical protein